MYYFYILYSKHADRFYIGSGKNLDDQIEWHNSNRSGTTGMANDWELVHSEPFDSKSDAQHRERQIKSWNNRKRLEAFLFQLGK